MGVSSLIDLREIERTRESLPKILRWTPIVPFAAQPQRMGAERLFLKAENLQITGAFKPRAAFARFNSLGKRARKRGIVLASSGNFAQAFALAGKLFNTKIVCVMLDRTSPAKVDGARALGAEVVFCGANAAGRQSFVENLASERGMVAIDTWEDRELIAGHGSLGLEILKDVPDVRTVLVPVSSGGAAAGISAAIKQSRPTVKVIGVQPEGANAAYLSRREGHLVTLDRWSSIADGLSAVRPGALPFAHLERFLDDIVLVSDAEIAASCRTLLYRCKILAEPAGATATAAYICGKVREQESTVSVVTGGNITEAALRSLFDSALCEPSAGPRQD